MEQRQHFAIKEIWQKDERTLGVVWSDNAETSYDVVYLREKCPCASCVDEMTGKPKLKPEEVSPAVRPLVIKSIGRYAMTIQFNDGHQTGIYSFDLLRKLADL